MKLKWFLLHMLFRNEIKTESEFIQLELTDDDASSVVSDDASCIMNSNFLSATQLLYDDLEAENEIQISYIK